MEFLNKFIKDPEWHLMEKFIMEHFEGETNIDSIDVSNSPETVCAEVIARQRISKDLADLKASFDNVRTGKVNRKVSFK